VHESAIGTPRRIAAVRRVGRDRSEADMPRASGADRSDENDPNRKSSGRFCCAAQQSAAPSMAPARDGGEKITPADERNDRAHLRAASPSAGSPFFHLHGDADVNRKDAAAHQVRIPHGGWRSAARFRTFQDYPRGWHRLWFVVLRGLDRAITRRPYTGSPHSKRGMIGSVITSTRPAFARVART
jgi:hypothetical protein